MLMKIRAKLKNQKGFTLIELLVVISIIGVLASIAIPRFTDSTARANTAKIAADLSNIDSAIGMNQVVNGADPASIAVLVTNGHLASEPTVPTGRAFIATTTTTEGVTTITPATATTAISGTYGFTTTVPIRATFGGRTAEHFR